MGFIGGLLGKGSSGGNWKAQQAPIIQGVNTDQINQAYGQAQTGLQQQQALLQALQGQQGIQNQSNVFNQQQGLANQFQGVANGTGPNPALQQLQNTTGQNVANQAALMAGQRGSSANSGLLARQIAQQGAGIQQQAVGQGAALQAQQQLAAMQALQGQQGLMGNLATQQVGQQTGAIQGYNAAAQNEQNSLLGALGQFNQAQVGSTGSQNAANAAIQGKVASGQQGLLGGVLSAVGGGAASSAAHGGIVQKYDEGGVVTPEVSKPQMDSGPASFVGKFFSNPAETPAPSASNNIPMMTDDAGANALEKGVANMFGAGIKKMATSMAPLLAASRGGAVVPGKAAIPGDNLKNDKVPALLSPKEIILPRSITLSKDAPEKAKRFVAALLAKNGMSKK